MHDYKHAISYRDNCKEFSYALTAILIQSPNHYIIYSIAMPNMSQCSVIGNL